MERSAFRSSQRFQREPHNVREEDSIFSIATTSACRYVSDSSSENTLRLDESLNDLIKYISDVDRVTRLTLKNRQLKEFLTYSPVILNASTTSIVTRSKFYRFLFNVAHHNIPLRRYMAGELRLLGSVVACLKASLREQLGPQNMIDILRLLQVLSYEKNVPLEHWANELISFLMGEVICEPEPEWMPYCIAILCNLASSSKSACKRIKISNSYKKFNRRLMKLLQHEARIIVVSSLVLIGYLDEKVRDMVYCSENVHDTFMCTFNVLTIGDDECMMTRQIAADLLRRLVVSESSTTPQVPSLASTGKNVLNYGFFLGSIQQTAKLLVTLDPRTEESAKVYDLLLAFCSLQVLRSPVCQAIIRCAPTESQLTTPLMAISETAGISFEDSINGEVPLKALKMLSYLFKEIVEPHERLADDVSLNQIIDLISNCVRTNIDIESENVDMACQRLQYGLRLAEVCGRDEDCRNHLMTVCTAHLCHQIANWQFLQNPVVTYLTRPPKERTEVLASWTIYGIGIVLELCRVLAVFKDHSKVHKDQYWKLLKDERIIPFLAYAISFGDQEMVQHAFVTYSHCAQVAAFPSHLLAEMVASCKAQNSKPVEERMNQTERPRSEYERPSSVEPDEKSQKALDELLRKVTLEGSSIRDAKTSELFSAYERKIQLLQVRERDLESLVRAKEDALAQSEKLRQYRAAGINHLSETELSKIREVTQECESLREQNKQLSDYVATAKAEYDRAIQRSTLECDQLKSELKDVKGTAESYSKTCNDLETSLGLSIAETARLKTELENARAHADRTALAGRTEISKLNADLAQNVARIEQFLNENNGLRRQLDEKSVECEAQREHIDQVEAQIVIIKKDLDRATLQTSNAEQKVAAKEIELMEAEKHMAAYETRLSEKERQCGELSVTVEQLRKELNSATQRLEALERMKADMLLLMK